MTLVNFSCGKALGWCMLCFFAWRLSAAPVTADEPQDLKYSGLLQKGQDHVVLRTHEQWGRILTPIERRCATQNARNVTLPTKQFVQETVQPCTQHPFFCLM